VPIAFGDVAGWERMMRSTGLRRVLDSVPARDLGAIRERADKIFEASRDARGRIDSWQEARYTLGTCP
jgi:hypothetical protein